jgi:hypothetical protein
LLTSLRSTRKTIRQMITSIFTVAKSQKIMLSRRPTIAKLSELSLSNSEETDYGVVHTHPRV